MGVLMLTGALGPALGRLTDRCRAHRVVLVLGNFGLALACVAYGLSSERDAILGLSIGFIPDQDRWSTDKRTVQCVRARLDHVSFARVPAYPTARIAAVRAATPLRRHCCIWPGSGNHDRAAASLPRLRPTNPQRITLPTMFTTS
jgi:hypothetical protein